MIALTQTSRRPAFTLIEMIIAMVVGVIISGVAGSLVWNATTLRSETCARGELLNSAASALELMLRYCREIQQDECPANPTPCLYGNAQVASASATAITFGTSGFRKTGSVLEMTTNGGTSWWPLAKNVSTFTVDYYNKSGAALSSLPLNATDRNSIRRIHLTLELSIGSQTAKVRCGLYLRSFMNEVVNP